MFLKQNPSTVFLTAVMHDTRHAYRKTAFHVMKLSFNQFYFGMDMNVHNSALLFFLFIQCCDTTTEGV